MARCIARQLVHAAAQLQPFGRQQHLVARLEQQQAAVAVGGALLPLLRDLRLAAREVERLLHALGALLHCGQRRRLRVVERAVDGQARLRAVDEREGRCARRRLHLAVERQLERRQVYVPVVALRVGVAAQRGGERLDLALRLPVRLRVLRRRQVDLAAQQTRQLPPELAP